MSYSPSIGQDLAIFPCFETGRHMVSLWNKKTLGVTPDLTSTLSHTGVDFRYPDRMAAGPVVVTPDGPAHDLCQM